MIAVEVEKEIDRENKIIAGLTMRQLLCIGTVAALSVVTELVTKLDISVSFYTFAGFGGVGLLFGWYKRDGIPFEKILMKEIRTLVYHSNVRKYRTKNRYVELMNAEYSRRRNADLADKKTAKEMKKDAKKQARQIKKKRKHPECVAVK